ncbi:MAG: amidohydrolase [Armatimonadetes bacterium]|nr:amidohydrolase [Armatimonadota bacterium]
MNNTLEETIARITPELIETRHHIHQNPELSDQEAGTARLVAARLAALGLEVRAEVGGHGVIGTLRGARPGRTLALRADMDALPIGEESDLPYRSQNVGVMHACGHDGHTTVLLGAAQALAAERDRIAGSVRFLFQPSEETGQGARRMCAAGAMDGVDAAAALHAWPPLPVGQIGIRMGAMTASADTFDILIHGSGAHAAYPHLSADPVVAAAQVILALQTLVSREIDPVEPAVVSVTQVSAGTAPNVIPETVRLAGTVRTHSNAVREAIPERMRRVVEGVCAAGRAHAEIHFRQGTPPLVNDPSVAALIADAAGETLGRENVILLPHASMGAEDFAEYLAYAPGALLRLGLGQPTPLHAPTFDFPDAALPVGVRVLSAFALRFLGA